MSDVQKSARLRAPRDTGDLAKSIVVTDEGKGRFVLSVNSRQGIFQEEGFKPHFIFVKDGKVNGEPMRTNNFWADGFHWVSKHKPFVGPALEQNLGKLAQRMGNATSKGIRKADRGGR